MMGSARGRLAVALDLLTDSLALVGQHGVYCRSERFPGKPKMDIALVLEQLDDAKQLVQSAMERAQAQRRAVEVCRLRRASSCILESRPGSSSSVETWRPRRLGASCQRDRISSHTTPGTQNIAPSANDRSRGDQPAWSSSYAGPVARERRDQRDERELRREHPSAKSIGHFHLQQHGAEDPENRAAEMRQQDASAAIGSVGAADSAT